jgi:ComF family protein
MNRLVDYFLHLIFPPKCMFCRELLRDEDAVYCDKCFGSLPEFEGSDPKVPGFDQAMATFHYREPIRYTILRYKFYGMKVYGPIFAKWMAGTVRDKLKEPCDLVSWVPCSTLRRWKRGYDQAEILAGAIADELGLEVRPVLHKVRHNPAQSGINDSARRKANVLNAYNVIDPESIAGKHILLVDDVLTTGATLAECGKILRQANCRLLSCAVIAAAGGDNEKDK